MSRYASAIPDHSSVPAKMALPSWLMVAAAVVSVCVCVFTCVLMHLCASVCKYLSRCGQPPTRVTPPAVCLTACSNSATDVVFLIDGSKSVRPENFELVKKWINQIVDKLDVSESKAHVGLVQYSSSVRQVRVCLLPPGGPIPASFMSTSGVFLPRRRSSPWDATTTRRT